MHDIFSVIGELIRLAVAIVGFVAMWSLWVARAERKHIWTTKMRDIWLCHILLVGSAVEANIEHLYRHHAPTAATVLVFFVMLLTVKGTFNGDIYTINELHKEE